MFDKRLSWLLPLSGRDLSGREANAMVVFSSNRSILFARVFSSLGPAATPIAIVMGILGVTLLVIELGSLTWSVRLTRTITRSVHDLYEATRQVAAGNLTHRAPVRGYDQLTELSGSFNAMTARVEQLIADIKDKEKIEAELAIARRVQIELFPRTCRASHRSNWRVCACRAAL